MHRAAAAEMLYLLEPSNKGKAVKLIEDSSNNLVQRNGALGSVKEWKLKDCIAVHKLLSSVVVDTDVASRWKLRCAEYFLHSTYFEGSCSSAVLKSSYNQISHNPENGLNPPAGGISIWILLRQMENWKLLRTSLYLTSGVESSFWAM
ncbi:N-terminal acetyltransferase A complex auxiliary subunit NAA15-like [Eucalyptus grandis]|uniref:N-terminal acetyltransferase A complex auxiliary subunit NAA15-like n=1 Tax=Eucalyptus grandis TaxID=71139 RepID=UPI00192EE6A2|nr:N-terminal acetyltransferase A complex auxiliary subunit NAA15-like [Eucalyptus grandis]